MCAELSGALRYSKFCTNVGTAPRSPKLTSDVRFGERGVTKKFHSVKNELHPNSSSLNVFFYLLGDGGGVNLGLCMSCGKDIECASLEKVKAMC